MGEKKNEVSGGQRDMSAVAVKSTISAAERNGVEDHWKKKKNVDI